MGGKFGLRGRLPFEKNVTVQQRRFAAAADARKRTAKCATAHEQADGSKARLRSRCGAAERLRKTGQCVPAIPL